MIRKYSVDEVDRLRQILRGRMRFGVDKQVDEATLEARIRTYMAASVDPEDLATTLSVAMRKSFEEAREEAINYPNHSLRGAVLNNVNRKLAAAIDEYGVNPFENEV